MDWLPGLWLCLVEFILRILVVYHRGHLKNPAFCYAPQGIRTVATASLCTLGNLAPASFQSGRRWISLCKPVVSFFSLEQCLKWFWQNWQFYPLNQSLPFVATNGSCRYPVHAISPLRSALH
jgi:hypothetical protein